MQQAESHGAPQRPLSVEEVSFLASRLAFKVARNPSDADDLQQIGLFEYHQAALDTKEVTNPFGFAKTVLLRAMWRFYASPMQGEEVSLEEEEVGYESGDCRNLVLGHYDQAATDNFELKEYFLSLEKACGPLAREIAENLISPQGDCAEAIVKRARIQAEKQANATAATKKHAPRGVKGEIRLSHPTINAAMGISSRSWWTEMRKIRAFTRQYLAAC